MAGAGNGGETRGSVRQKIAAEMVLVVAEMAAVAVVAVAMATVGIAATTRQPWQWLRQRGSYRPNTDRKYRIGI